MRYAGIPAGKGQEFESLTKLMAAEVESICQPRMIYKVMEIELQENGIFLPAAGMLLSGNTAYKMLKNCSKVIVAAATLGSVFDFALQKYMNTDISQGLLFDACGSAGIEAYLDEQQARLASQYPDYCFTDRFSCGYGDLPLELQKEISTLLDLPLRAGIFVQDSLMMNPSKSVTAFIGLSDQPQPARVRGCQYCSLAGNCQLRKEGKNCGI